MPPFRQPTPSPPPPPMPPSVSAPTLPLPSGNEGEAQSDGNAMGDGGIEIPPDFVPPPPPREVATGVANLGNTCYMNAALQALAHAPELCHALDAESHLRTCPVALRNERRRRKRARELAAAGKGEGGNGGAVDAKGDANQDAANNAQKQNEEQQTATSSQQQTSQGNAKKSHRRSNSSSSNGSAGSKGSKSRRKKKDELNGSSIQYYDPDYEFCTLCEVERLLGRVHSRPEETLEGIQEEENEESSKDASSKDNAKPPQAPPVNNTQDGPMVPEAFVSGFMSKVAPWFRRGVQEDSHEFLRLLIDAMQNSCKGARKKPAEDNKCDLQDSDEEEGKQQDQQQQQVDNEYPFRLFRGTVESNVKCSACRATSRKIDPIEDIGLDILPLARPNPPSLGTRGGGSSSRSTSPAANMALADVTQALERFISSEHLDSGYKCEKCGRLGKATKTSKLASIPPILTLHLKRFRYGSGGGNGGSKRGGRGDGTRPYYGETDGANTGSTRSGRSARGAGDFVDLGGPSGSAKIEGHVGFNRVLDMKPYLTPELQQTGFKPMCRLFAVVVHSGKNSHSGHYVAYVSNVNNQKEWWKMDDGKVFLSSWDEVCRAEAYMLFYRVMTHPVGLHLKSIADKKEASARRIMNEIKRRADEKREAEEARRAEAVAAAKKAAAALQDLVEKTPDVPQDPSSDMERSPSPPLGKRARPALASGEEWSHAVTTLSPDYNPLFMRIQEFITDNVTFSPEFFGYITEEYNRMSSKLSVGRRVKNNKRIKTLLGKGPGGVYPPEDIVGGGDDLSRGIMDLFHQIFIMYKQQNTNGGKEPTFLLPKTTEEMVVPPVPTSLDDVVNEDTKSGGSKDGTTTPAEIVPPASPELVIAPDNDCYDGAL